VVVKASITALGPLVFTALRYGVAALTLFGLLRWRRGAIRWPGPIGWRLMALGVMGFGFYQVSWTLGLTQITAGDSALLVACSPVLTALIAGALGLDRLTVPKMAGAAVAFVGVAIVVTQGHAMSLGASLVGDAITLFAACMWAIYTVAGARVLRTVDPLDATAWSVLGGLLFLIPFGVGDLLVAPPASWSLGVVVGVLYSGSLAAGIANVLVFRAIVVVGPTRAASAQLLVPFGAVMLGAVFLLEPVGVGQVVGGLIIVAGLLLTRQRSFKPSLSLPHRASG
jgi:drug/metabolite transporter (DMT)-like permease